MLIDPKYVKLANELKDKNKEVEVIMARLKEIYKELTEGALAKIEAEAGIEIINRKAE